ncbi:MAG: hypothetical protein LBR60_01540 [Fibrobacter sp.]|nr:hypothetical protein [Fibrobacter sp.]
MNGGFGDYCPEDAYSGNAVLYKKDTGNMTNEQDKFEYLPVLIQYYDALGRKTTGHPETKRHLFWKRKQKQNNLFGKESIYDFSGSFSFIVKSTLEGFVDVWHSYNVRWKLDSFSQERIRQLNNCNCHSSTSILLTAIVSMELTTTIQSFVHHDNPLLAEHENRHVKIYNALGNDKWESDMTIDYCHRAEVCSKAKELAKRDFEMRIRTLVEAQNKWDDEDENNTSQERINLQEELNKMYKEIDKIFQTCVW